MYSDEILNLKFVENRNLTCMKNKNAFSDWHGKNRHFVKLLLIVFLHKGLQNLGSFAFLQ